MERRSLSLTLALARTLALALTLALILALILMRDVGVLGRAADYGGGASGSPGIKDDSNRFQTSVAPETGHGRCSPHSPRRVPRPRPSQDLLNTVAGTDADAG